MVHTFIIVLLLPLCCRPADNQSPTPTPLQQFSAIWQGLPADLQYHIFEKHITRQLTTDAFLSLAICCGWYNIDKKGWGNCAALANAHADAVVQEMQDRQADQDYPSALVIDKHIRWSPELAEYSQLLAGFNIRRSLQRCAMRRVRQQCALPNLIMDVYFDQIDSHTGLRALLDSSGALDIPYIDVHGYVDWVH